MCGIFGYLGKKQRIIKKSIKALKILRSRGYDSAGIGFILNNQIMTTKSVNLDLDQLYKEKMKNFQSYSAISHTRWATNGKISIENTHPFISSNKKFVLVHNGIIDNAELIKKKLLPYKKFNSETDSEVIVNLIEFNYEKYKDIKTFKQILRITFSQLNGFWGILLIKLDEPLNLYITRKEIPLVVGFNRFSFYVSSDYNTFSEYVDKYFELKNNDILCLSYDPINNEVNSYDVKDYIVTYINQNEILSETPYPFKFWLEKEIKQQDLEILNMFKKNRMTLNKNNIIFPKIDLELQKNLNNFLYDKIILLGSGTSFHACLLGEIYLKKMTKFEVQCFNTSDFLDYDIPKSKTLFIIVSQSGETKDLLDIIKKIKKKKLSEILYKFISITNSYNSLIPRNSDFNLYLKISKEISVASTKTFVCSSIMLFILSLKLSSNYVVNLDCIYEISHNFNKMINDLELHKKLENILNKIYKNNIIFLSSNKNNNPIALEANLKFREICYTFSLSSSAKNLKHGPLALVDENCYIFHFVNNEFDYKYAQSVMNEIKSRNGNNILITSYNKYNPDLFTDIIEIDTNCEIINNLLLIYPMQLLTFLYGKKAGYTIDTPKNLAKTVTV
jgi:glucosamine--fructose-6-phosphate aminotransferase (isomerizing)